MTLRSKRAAPGIAAVIIVTGVACGGGAKVAVPLPRAPEPAVSPAAQAKLPGAVLPLAGAPEGIATIRSGTVDDTTGQLIVTGSPPQGFLQFIPLGEPSSTSRS